MDVGDWLRSLDLGQYEAAFRDNAIDSAVLPKLTADDLKEIGVVAVGHRRRLLDGIAALGFSGDSSDVSPAPSIAPAPTVSRPVAAASPSASGSTASAERRPITVMFCDLVGSTSLAAKLDPEDWRNLVGSYLDAASTAVTSLGGHVLKKLGDGLMALFGYPQAQENDGERAVRAALAIQRALADLNARNAATGAPELSARIGLDSGRVVVDSTGEVYGEAPNVAARAQSAASPGEIWITRAVHRQIAGLFVAEDKGEHELKGVPEKTQLYRVVRVSGGGRRGGSRAPTPLVGRAEELDLLARRWERARRGEGQLSLIVGEPGLGKSRLIEEFRARLAETPHTWIEWASSQLLQNTPLHPAAEWGRARFGGAEVDGQKRLAELEAALGSVGLDPAEYAPLLAPVIDAPLPPERIPKLSPEELRSRQLAALAAWVLAGARTQPLVLVFEDLHWVDPTSLDVLQALAERGAQAPLLIIATTRPEFRPPWKLRSHHGVISLAPLDAGEVARMVGEIATRHALSKDVIAGVSERSGGVPLFVEEVTRLLLERGEAGGVQAIPPTLQQSLAARLDRLGAAREIAQIGAVLGRGFSHALLRAVAGLEEPALRAALDRLANSELLFVEGVAPHANYRFKHALIQDAAYDSLLKSRRQTLHRRAAEVLLASPAQEAEALAHHFTQAGQTELAIEWWGKAGDQALRRSAFAEAISHLGKAIEMADKAAGAAANAPAPADQRLKLQTSYGQAMGYSKGFAAEETKAVLAQTLRLAAQSDNVSERMKAHYARWIALYTGGELKSAHEIAEGFVREAKLAGDAPAAAYAERVLGQTCVFQGRFAEGREHLSEALRVYSPGWDASVRRQLGSDAGIGAKAFLAMVAWHVGDAAGAAGQFEAALTEALASEHVPTIANNFLFKAMHEMARGDAEATLAGANVVLDVAEKSGLRLYESTAHMLLSWAKARLGAADGLARFGGQGETTINQDAPLFAPLFHGRLAELEAEQTSLEAALASIDRAIELARAGDIRYIDALLYRIRGDILLKADPANPARAEETFLTAVSVAREQGARGFGLEAALALAKFYQSTNRAADAHDILGPALEGFSPTPEFPQTAEAKALFEALAETEEVRAEAARRAQRLKLQTTYGQAVMWGKGFAADETKDAFARAAELATRIGGPEAPLDAYVARWAHSYFRGELGLALEAAERLLRGAVRAARPTEAAAGHRLLGLTRLVQGDFAQAREDCEQALRIYDPERDREAKFRLGVDTRAMATAYLALLAWHRGEVSRAVALMDEAVAHAAESAHVPTIVGVYLHQAWLEDLRADAEAAQRAAEAAVALSREHGLMSYLIWAALPLACARAKIGDRDASSAELRQALADYANQGNKFQLPFYRGLLAEIEAEGGDATAALVGIDEALALAGETGEHWFDAGLHRIRGEILVEQNPADPAPAEAAFLAAIAVARQQKARSFELRAALSLAKLYQSTGRLTDAHDVLGPALEGFAPTPEFPQIAEAKALLAD